MDPPMSGRQKSPARAGMNPWWHRHKLNNGLRQETTIHIESIDGAGNQEAVSPSLTHWGFWKSRELSQFHFSLAEPRLKRSLVYSVNAKTKIFAMIFKLVEGNSVCSMPSLRWEGLERVSQRASLYAVRATAQYAHNATKRTISLLVV